MKEHLFGSELWLARLPAEIFPSFADAKNLGAITPPWLHFKILTPGEIQMGVGALIDYRISLHGLPLRWRTKIGQRSSLPCPRQVSLFFGRPRMEKAMPRWIN